MIAEATAQTGALEGADSPSRDDLEVCRRGRVGEPAWGRGPCAACHHALSLRPRALVTLPAAEHSQAELGWLFTDGVAAAARDPAQPPQRLGRTDLHLLHRRELAYQDAERQLLLRLPLDELGVRHCQAGMRAQTQERGTSEGHPLDSMHPSTPSSAGLVSLHQAICRAGMLAIPVSSARPIPPPPLGAVGLWRQRVQERVPLQYLTRAAHWRDMVLAVAPGVLIPRPETELLVDLALQAVRARPQLRSLPWADLGTGSGCLACGLARSLGAPRVFAVDRATAPVAVARANADRLGVGERVTVLQGSWAEPLLQPDLGLASGCGGLVSNPPYIPTQDLAGLQAEVGR